MRKTEDRRQNGMRKRNGFTLIELLVVIAIIALLMGVLGISLAVMALWPGLGIGLGPVLGILVTQASMSSCLAA